MRWRFAWAWTIGITLACGGNLPPQPPEPPEPEPEPQCHVIGATCDCYHKPPGEDWQWIDCPEPPDPPDPGTCPLGTPHASRVPRAQVKLAGYGRGFQATPFGCFGRDYYCSEAMNWPEACADARSCGPVAPDGHPQREVCEQAFLGTECPVWWGECTPPITGASCPITFDVLIGDDPHRMNETCPDPHPNHQENPEVFWGRPEGRGKVWACAVMPDGSVVACTETPKRVDQ
jgi:hypothetical protein